MLLADGLCSQQHQPCAHFRRWNAVDILGLVTSFFSRLFFIIFMFLFPFGVVVIPENLFVAFHFPSPGRTLVFFISLLLYS